MYYALTIRGDLITGVHSSTTPFTPDQFERNPKLANDIVMPFEKGEYKAGHSMREYDGGKLLPLIDRIKAGLANIPPGHELIDGELIRQDAPAEELPPGIKKRLEMADARIAALEAEIEKIVPFMTGLGQGVLDFNRIEEPKTYKTTKEGVG